MFSDLYAYLSKLLGACLNAWLSLKQSSRHVCFGSIALSNFPKTLADLGWYSEMLIAPARFRKTFQQLQFICVIKARIFETAPSEWAGARVPRTSNEIASVLQY